MSTPTKSETRKVPCIYLQNSLNWPFSSIFHDDGSISAFNASMISVKIPVNKAIVPPETPGITFAAPIPNPFSPVSMFFVNAFILLNNGFQITSNFLEGVRRTEFMRWRIFHYEVESPARQLHTADFKYRA